jgi:hypothetical protein
VSIALPRALFFFEGLGRKKIPVENHLIKNIKNN